MISSITKCQISPFFSIRLSKCKWKKEEKGSLWGLYFFQRHYSFSDDITTFRKKDFSNYSERHQGKNTWYNYLSISWWQIFNKHTLVYLSTEHNLLDLFLLVNCFDRTIYFNVNLKDFVYNSIETIKYTQIRIFKTL